MGHIKDLLTTEEKQKVVRATRKAAVALAELWDAVRDIEQIHGLEFDRLSEGVVETLAADLSAHPRGKELSQQTILDYLDCCCLTGTRDE